MTILRTHAVPLAAALCLVLTAPAANAAGFMYFNDSPIAGDMPPPPPLATPTQPGTPRTQGSAVDGRDYLIWQRNMVSSPKADAPVSVKKFQAPTQLKAR